jgi:hypothetical protein
LRVTARYPHLEKVLDAHQPGHPPLTGLAQYFQRPASGQRPSPVDYLYGISQSQGLLSIVGYQHYRDAGLGQN